MTSKTMHASVPRGARDIALEERPLPEPDPHEVLVKVTRPQE
ncbi:hypothetical protein [Saccharopolyspora spinosa]|uniref:Alcohol dehydrogenase-like protein n=1 Tax=Saccharopolyspora spinosa TaxID=60894 RepID=A0A2N3XUM9_SACSN|nr:hypothetical protein [Saccharopolyspora spinosa]PKW14362.1 hypothetical protein A8926_1972 [Saccharopolyspora spinosa]